MHHIFDGNLMYCRFQDKSLLRWCLGIDFEGIILLAIDISTCNNHFRVIGFPTCKFFKGKDMHTFPTLLLVIIQSIRDQNNIYSVSTFKYCLDTIGIPSNIKSK